MDHSTGDCLKIKMQDIYNGFKFETQLQYQYIHNKLCFNFLLRLFYLDPYLKPCYWMRASCKLRLNIIRSCMHYGYYVVYFEKFKVFEFFFTSEHNFNYFSHKTSFIYVYCLTMDFSIHQIIVILMVKRYKVTGASVQTAIFV